MRKNRPWGRFFHLLTYFSAMVRLSPSKFDAFYQWKPKTISGVDMQLINQALFLLGQEAAVRRVKDDLHRLVDRLQDGYRTLKSDGAYIEVGESLLRCPSHVRGVRVSWDTFKESELEGGWIPYSVQWMPRKFCLASIFLRKEDSTETIRVSVPDRHFFFDWIGYAFVREAFMGNHLPFWGRKYDGLERDIFEKGMNDLWAEIFGDFDSHADRIADVVGGIHSAVIEDRPKPVITDMLGESDGGPDGGMEIYSFRIDGGLYVPVPWAMISGVYRLFKEVLS